MARHKFLVVVIVGFLTLCTELVSETRADTRSPRQKKPAPKFLRIRRDDRGRPLALETAIVRYASATGEGTVTVDLVGAVHVGDRDYYRQLNREMTQYDSLLYELVAPPGTRIPKGGRKSDNPIAIIQQLVKTFLDLDAQTDQIDYTKKNFVHADLSFEQMAEVMRKRGDTGVTVFLSIVADLMRQQNLQEQKQSKDSAKSEDVDFMALLGQLDNPRKLKLLMAQQFEDLSDPSRGLPQTLTTILVNDRNEAALKVLQKELAKGKKKLGIFFGAAHMPDFDKRLRQDFGLNPVSHKWVRAWDLQKEPTGVEGLLKLLDQFMQDD